ncbi:hypothetical protein K493DRAFT_302094 [Basidiobolus meristosporus CBS 931.73]|uniref:Uncharacterized protein n=1 Tax=Basidiobolus meristosporus CBS 931.73 TaxID=1314790 RepID=A0A1Y1Y8N7_9FUNG|nr:hypothetical protein K493DRAFT_302094 [Basidiobolus meristosporus CBS 931.73]|eukprot:ORX94381.1 hypothetical protein K493DRAFT_302094 [Basidiobolus meristosporus CBS 931.73]
MSDQLSSEAPHVGLDPHDLEKLNAPFYVSVGVGRPRIIRSNTISSTTSPIINTSGSGDICQETLQQQLEKQQEVIDGMQEKLAQNRAEAPEITFSFFDDEGGYEHEDAYDEGIVFDEFNEAFLEDFLSESEDVDERYDRLSGVLQNLIDQAETVLERGESSGLSLHFRRGSRSSVVTISRSRRSSVESTVLRRESVNKEFKKMDKLVEAQEFTEAEEDIQTLNGDEPLDSQKGLSHSEDMHNLEFSESQEEDLFAFLKKSLSVEKAAHDLPQIMTRVIVDVAALCSLLVKAVSGSVKRPTVKELALYLALRNKYRNNRISNTS